MYVVNRVLLTPIVFEFSLDLSPGADRFAHVDEGSEPTRVSSNSRFFDFYSPRALYRCFWKQQGHVLCYSTMVLGQPTGLLVHGRWLLELICQPGGGGRKVNHVSFFSPRLWIRRSLQELRGPGISLRLLSPRECQGLLLDLLPVQECLQARLVPIFDSVG